GPLASPDGQSGEESRPPGSTSVDVEHQFSAFPDGTPPLFYQAPHIVDQSGQVILVDAYPLLFHAVLETGGIEALIRLHVVQSLVAVFEPDCLVVPVFVFVAGRAHSGGKVVEQRNQLFRFNETGGVHIPDFFHRPKTLAHCLTPFFLLFLGHSESDDRALIRCHTIGSTGSEVVRPVCRFTNPPWYERRPYRNSRANIASAW